MSLLEIRDLTIRYDGETVVDGVDLSVERGASVGLVGESGSGKSQCALAVLGLLPSRAAVSGSIEFDGRELIGAGQKVLDEVRARRIGIVFQDPMQALNPYLRIGAQLGQILRSHGLADGREADARVVEMLARVGLPDAERQFAAWPHELSGGMRQRAMIASALIAQPDLLIADEPTTALDVTVQVQVLELLERIRDDTALLLITHDLGIVAGYCEGMTVLEEGRVVDSGSTTSLFHSPGHRHTRELIAAAPRVDRGEPPAPVATGTVLSVGKAAGEFGDLRAVDDVSFAGGAGETVAIVGESGSGKTSLVRAVLGLLPLATGRVVYAGDALPRGVEKRALAVRRDLQLVFQDPMSALDPQMRVRKIVAEPLVVHEPRLDEKGRRERIVAVLEQVGLGERFLDRYPHQLSGGEAQRACIARALVLEPKVLVCDEAVAALDGSVRQQVLALLSEVQRETGLSIIFISHDLAVVRSISHRALVMYSGRLVELAESGTLFGAPRHPYTQALIAAVPVPDPVLAPRPAPLPGEAPSLVSPPPGCAFHPRCPVAETVCRAEAPPLRNVGSTQVACHLAE